MSIKNFILSYFKPDSSQDESKTFTDYYYFIISSIILLFIVTIIIFSTIFRHWAFIFIIIIPIVFFIVEVYIFSKKRSSLRVLALFVTLLGYIMLFILYFYKIPHVIIITFIVLTILIFWKNYRDTRFPYQNKRIR
ncbi:MAG: hypothetical protein K9W44_09195 [Candidatus Lokiarchaeota archaeon]|nr:hypothetical protein [Candidatus Harpocratesius repetitus]